MSYSDDMRRLVMGYVAGGGSKSDAARIYGVSRATLYIWIRQEKLQQGAKKPGPKGGHRLSETKLKQAIAARPDAQLRELGAELGVHYSTVHYALKRLKMSRKKNVAV